MVSPLLLEELECSEQSFVSYAHRRKDIFGQVFGSLWQVVVDVVEVILIANAPVSDQLVESQSERSHCPLLVVHLVEFSVQSPHQTEIADDDDSWDSLLIKIVVESFGTECSEQHHVLEVGDGSVGIDEPFLELLDVVSIDDDLLMRED